MANVYSPMVIDSPKIAIAQFITSERKRLTAYVRHLIDDASDRDGEDIVQDVALSLFDRTDVLMPIDAMSSYIYQALRNRVIDHLRRRRVKISLDAPTDSDDDSSLVHELVDHLTNVEDEASRRELKRSLFTAMNSLPDDQKAIVIETEINGRSFRELAKNWDVPIGTLLARKSRAIAKIRELLHDFRP
jgi:RNA polymerase sigma factor (sigma-70 family)